MVVSLPCPLKAALTEDHHEKQKSVSDNRRNGSGSLQPISSKAGWNDSPWSAPHGSGPGNLGSSSPLDDSVALRWAR